MPRPAMNGQAGDFVGRAAALRLAFDASFAAPLSAVGVAPENMLAIGVGTAPFIVRLGDIAGLFAENRIVRLPTQIPSLLGVAGFRRAILPVYDLRLLLGQEGSTVPRWFVVAAAAPVAFAFNNLDGHLHVAERDVVTQAPGREGQRHVRGYVERDRAARPIIHVSSILDAIRQLTGENAAKQELQGDV
jgi:chemotaxis signal transduction protein